MPTFSQRSKDRLAECHPDLQTLFNEVIKHMDVTIICGHRGEEEQNSLYPKYTKVKWPNSNHNKTPSHAVDVAPYPIDWEDIGRFKEMGRLVLAIADLMYRYGEISHRIEWGGHWRSFKDFPHFEIAD